MTAFDEIDTVEVSGEIAVVVEPASAELQQLAEDAREFVDASRAQSTRRAYRADWAAFRRWCAAHAFESLPARPEVVATYSSYLIRRGLGVSSVARAMAAISQAHQMAGHESPTKSSLVRQTLRGIRRTKGIAPTRKTPVTVVELRTMVATLGDGPMAVRDRAVLLLGFAGAFRRSELAGLDVADLDFCDRGVVVTVRKSKTDQEGEGMVKAIPFAVDAEMCPVLALRAWFEFAGIESGAVFRTMDRWGHIVDGRMSDLCVARVVKRAAKAAGLDASRFAGHSLRAGFATAAILAGREEADVMRQTGHRSVRVFRGYVRVADAWRRNAATGLL